MSLRRALGIALCVVLIAVSWFGIVNLRTGLVVRSIAKQGVPMIFMAPETVKNRPGILIAHGFAGSKQLMLGYGYTLAHNGYGVLLLDFAGHGENASPLDKSKLQENLNAGLSVLKAQPEIDPNKIGLLGHSMGSRAVMLTGIEQADAISAVVAISPVVAPVTSSKPRNLQLQAGEWEGQFVQQSAQLLREAGGKNPNTDEGKGRERIIVPQAEHILILFKDLSHQSALKWFNAVYHRATTNEFRDRRMAWYGLHLLSWMFLLGLCSSRLKTDLYRPRRLPRPTRTWIGLGISPLVATGVVAVMSHWTSLEDLGGLLIGGAFALWLFIAGLCWSGIISHYPRLRQNGIALGVLLFGILWIAFGLMAQETWLQWWLIPTRLKLWPVLSIGCFPWFFASGIAQERVTFMKGIIWWLAQSIAVILGLSLTLIFVPKLGFLALIIPVIPIILAMLAYVAFQVRECWSYAIGSALFFGWIIASVFPLSG